MKRILIGATIAAMALTGTVFAQDSEPFKMEIKARQGIMAYRAVNLGVLGAMAKGDMEFDAAKAQAAADAIVSTLKIDQSMLWPQGSGNSANPASRANDEIWKAGSTIGESGKAFADAAMAMQAAAGSLEGINGAMGAMGGACNACHKAFRVSAN